MKKILFVSILLLFAFSGVEGNSLKVIGPNGQTYFTDEWYGMNMDGSTLEMIIFTQHNEPARCPEPLSCANCPPVYVPMAGCSSTKSIKK